MGRFRSCYLETLRTQPSFAGRAELRFRIQRDGTVAKVSVGGLDDAPELTACLEKQAYGITFTQPEGGVVDVLYPLKLVPPKSSKPAPRYGYR
jgi:hypothetical protein